MKKRTFGDRRKPRPANHSRPNESRRPQASGRADAGAEEQKYHGRHACHAVFTHRPDDIIRVYVVEERLKEFGPLLKWCAEKRRAYHIVEPENLERVADTVHHQGIVILARRASPLRDEQLLEAVRTGRIPGPLIYLDGVQNPHNLGSILRTAAHFGAGAVLGQKDELPGVTASAARVAEGGAEAVETAWLSNPVATLTELKSMGFRIFAATSHPGGNVYASTIPVRSVMILGSEVLGVSQELTAIADASLQIPGTGAVESLNVAVACGVLLSELVRRKLSSDQAMPKNQPSPPRSSRSRGKSRRAR